MLETVSASPTEASAGATPPRPICDWYVTEGTAVCGTCGMVAGMDNPALCLGDPASVSDNFWVHLMVLWICFLAVCAATAWFGLIPPAVMHG
jgi:hypothetical protein